VKEAERGSVIQTSGINFIAPTVSAPERIRLRLELRNDTNDLIAQNYMDLFIYPEPHKRSGLIYLQSGLEALAGPLRRVGYNVVNSPTQESVIFTNKLDEQTQSFLRSGYRVIVFADSIDAIPSDISIRIAPRNGQTGYDGNWVSNFNWVSNKAAPFQTIGFNPLQGFEAREVTPAFVIEGIKGQDYTDVLSGMFFGWINKNAVLMLSAKSGEGRTIITTLRLAHSYQRDPYARRLLDGMIDLITSESFRPTLTLL
jgi:hypothetical protein